MWWERKVYTLCGVLLLAAILYLNFGGGDPTIIKIPIPWLQPRMGFVRRNGTHFFVVDDVDGGKNSAFTPSPLYVNGWNSYWLLAASSSGEKSKVSEMLRKGKEMGMEVCRTWAFSDGGPNALLISPGRFDENVFQALDYVIYEARRNGVRLILSLVNNLRAFGGKAQYVKWAIEAGVNVSSSGDSFFEHSTIKGYYKDYAKAILTRKNSYSGVRYYDEPAIFAWELMNEPRCASNSSSPLLQAWILEMSLYVKSLDKKHLVTIGLEGFYGSERPEKLMANPGDWAASVGSDFIQNSAVEHIDFASVHAYPDSWIPNASLEEKAKYLSLWVDFHINDSEHILKKPVLFTEIGSSLHTKKHGLYGDIFLKAIYDKIYESAKKKQAGAGAFIWQLLVEGASRYGDEFSLVSSEHLTTSKLIMQQSCRLHYMLRNGETNRTIEWPCIGVKF